FHSEFKTKTVFTNSIFFWNSDIVKNKGVRITTSNTELLLLRADLKTWHSFLYYKSIDSFVLEFWMSLGNNQIHIRCRTIGDPVLCTVNNIVVTFLYCRSFL